jgi:hypothetical protein
MAQEKKRMNSRGFDDLLGIFNNKNTQIVLG